MWPKIFLLIFKGDCGQGETGVGGTGNAGKGRYRYPVFFFYSAITYCDRSPLVLLVQLNSLKSHIDV